MKQLSFDGVMTDAASGKTTLELAVVILIDAWNMFICVCGLIDHALLPTKLSLHFLDFQS